MLAAKAESSILGCINMSTDTKKIKERHVYWTVLTVLHPVLCHAVQDIDNLE